MERAQPSFSMGRIGYLLSLIVAATALAGVSVRAELEPPVPVRTVKPEFPYEMQRAGISGVVTLTVEVDETGAVQNSAVEKSSNPEFERPALEAVRKWRFKPARRDGVAVKIKIQLPIRFNLGGG